MLTLGSAFSPSLSQSQLEASKTTNSDNGKGNGKGNGMVKAKGGAWALGRGLEAALVVLVTACLTVQHAPELNRSGRGTAIHEYAESVLTTVGEGGVLLSHTDLDWNPVRYLQQCLGKRADVTHLSLQLMPYPWFVPQQARLYPNVTIPLPFDGVNTNRLEEGNAQQILRFLQANEKLIHPDQSWVKRSRAGSRKKSKSSGSGTA